MSPRSAPSWPRRAASALIGRYLRKPLISRGQWALRRAASRFLVARLDHGAWIRVSGVTALEWATLLGTESSEGRTAEVFARHLAAGACVVDVGANVGYYALLAAARVGRDGRVIAIEPGPATAARLRENARLNGCTNLEIVEAALSDTEGAMRLHLGEDAEGASLFAVEGEQQPSVTVVTRTLDGVAAERGLRRLDVLKIDAEGAEVRVLRGARETLAGHRPVILIEANPWTLAHAGESVAGLRALLAGHGYEIEVLERMPWRNVTVENWLARPYA